MSLNVTIPDTFNGPLDLLLHLIRRDEMDIYDIPIAKLTHSYIEEMERLEIVDVDEAAEFLDLASRLLEIKTRMLVPPEERVDDEEEPDDDFDPRSGLVEALLEYRRFKDAARTLGDMAEEQARRYPRVSPLMDFTVPPEEKERGDGMDLARAFQGLLVRLIPNDANGNVITYTEVPTSVRIEQIETVLRDIGTTRFSLLLSGTPDRREMVGFFIAMLELIRRGRVVARQTDSFTDILLEAIEAPAGGGRPPAFRPRDPSRRFPAPPAQKKRKACATAAAPRPPFPAIGAPRQKKRKRLRNLFYTMCRC